MMRMIMAALAASSLLGLTGIAPVAAQDNSKELFIYGSYFRCGGSMGRQADEAVTKWVKPVYDAAVTAGTISAWGWLAHRAGGDWARVAFHAAPSLQAALDASDQLDAKLMARENAK